MFFDTWPTSIQSIKTEFQSIPILYNTAYSQYHLIIINELGHTLGNIQMKYHHNIIVHLILAD